MAIRRIFFIIIALLFAGAALCAADQRLISVLYFQNTTKNTEYNWLSKGIADMLITDVAGSKELTVIEREEIEKIVKQQEQSLSDLFDESSAVRIGKLLSARQIVIGSFIILQTTLRIDAKVVDVETGKVLGGVQTSGEIAKLFDLQKQLAVNVLKELGVKPLTDIRRETDSFDAAKAYYTGISFLDEGAFDKAAQSFKQATNLDPYYLKPQKSLEDAYKFLKDFKKQRYQREIRELYQKAAEIKRRLSAAKWMSYSDLLSEGYQQGLSNDEIKKIADANPSYYICDTRAICTWNLQHTLLEIADLSVEYFEDTETEIRMYKEIMNITAQARIQFKNDPFFPEILYMELFALQHFKEWDRLMQACEFLMQNYPDYRMMWAVENFYERAIEAKKPKKPKK